MKNPFRKMPSEALYAQLGRVIESMPDLAKKLPVGSAYFPFGPQEHQWLGRAQALISEALGTEGDIEIKAAISQSGQYRDWFKGEVQRILYRALAVVEMELPAPATGAFIPAGNAFDALKAIQRIFDLAQKEVLVVDPYMDEKILTDFAHLMRERVQIRLLADASAVKASLAPAIAAWLKQYGTSRPIVAKLAPKRALHDRLIAIDSARIWTVGQSFRDLAARAPTSFVEVDKETAALKMQSYDDIWNAASPL
ncbi:phosphatidylserine/phosphatidylglycerophosphate/cardiolipin synthase family protein [Bradyrhizobium sp. 162]|uniref:phosphatidylserine/phosphatidylglycerophosphate/ cardiolipin synthase family protein n=1 Tax=Bradyrhizobium sp. 162 TaxID=2782635 RepID=UPI001FF90936|nr:phosphatidylserine/phosphatidylglycerophosphate/cardiolipin synthase family protein [Bradyrhizobium sp. 162]MCK1629666.1 phosphatidylserine/phosphatidylglycerophosphate/cardiolipin synthase family protein [Bradyrhizobium sp. 162]